MLRHVCFETVLLSYPVDHAERRATLLRAAYWCTNFGTNNKAWNEVPKIAPKATLPFPFSTSHWQIMRWLQIGAKLEIRSYNCCVNGCQAYIGGYSDATVCEGCGELRYEYVCHQAIRSCSHKLIHNIPIDHNGYEDRPTASVHVYLAVDYNVKTVTR